jgi:catechol 2,3-dioxygenase-like lactoylglutathione lyase family enzyme
MLNTSAFISFVATGKPVASRKFYEHTLGLKFVSSDRFALVFEANGSMLRIQKVKTVDPHDYTSLGWEVKDIRNEVSELGKRGVRFARFEGMAQDEQGIWKSPAGALIAWFSDPDGNILSLTQF